MVELEFEIRVEGASHNVVGRRKSKRIVLLRQINRESSH